MHRNALTLLCLLYGCLLVYASLMPFDFVQSGLSAQKLAHIWDAWPVRPAARISGADVASNLALYIPLGWLLTVRLLLGRVRAAWAIPLVVLLCSGVSAGVEYLQLFIQSRVTSGADWVLNTASGMTGAALGAFCGKGLWIHGIRWYRMCRRKRPADIVTLAILGLLAAEALSPYLPTIQLRQVWRSLKVSHWDPLGGLALHSWHWWLATRGAVYALITMLLAGWGGRRHGGWFRALAMAACLAAVLELAKPFIASRTFNAANITTAWAGCLAGCLIGAATGCRAGTRGLAWAGIIMLPAYEAYLALLPFNFTWDPERVRKVLPSPVQLLPFYHYAMGAKLEHVRLFAQSVCLQAILVALLKARFGWFAAGRFRKARAALLFGLFGLCLEACQLFLPSRTPSMTDIYCYALGAWLGAWLSLPEGPVERVSDDHHLPGKEGHAHESALHQGEIA